jgi:hypothetical protein
VTHLFGGIVAGNTAPAVPDVGSDIYGEGATADNSLGYKTGVRVHFSAKSTLPAFADQAFDLDVRAPD